MRAGIYVRISQDRKGARGGVTRQAQDCVELCERRGWDVADIYEDNDVSAFSGRERPAYQRLMGDVADGLVDVVVAWHTDRLWRSVIEQQLAMAAWREAGLAMVSTCSGGDVDPSSADDEFVATVVAAVAAKESADKARRARRKQAELRAEGRHTGGGIRAFGHTADREAVVEVEAAMVAEACERVAAGEGVGEVVDDWRRRGVVTAQGRPWRYGSLLRLLRQPRIAGLVAHRGEVVGTAAWPPLVDRGLWERTQAALDARRPAPRAARSRSLLGGVLRCGRCGCSIVAGGDAYRCPSRLQGGCGGVSLRRAWAEAVVGEAVCAWVEGPRFAEAVAARARDSAALDEALAAVADVEARLATLDLMFSSGEGVGGDYRAMRARLVGLLSDARGRVAALSGAEVVAPGRLDWSSLDEASRRAVVRAVLVAVEVAPVGFGRRSSVDRLTFEWRT